MNKHIIKGTTYVHVYLLYLSLTYVLTCMLTLIA